MRRAESSRALPPACAVNDRAVGSIGKQLEKRRKEAKTQLGFGARQYVAFRLRHARLETKGRHYAACSSSIGAALLHRSLAHARVYTIIVINSIAEINKQSGISQREETPPLTTTSP